MLMYGFGQLTLLFFIAVLCVYLINSKRNVWAEKLFFQYACFITLCRALYTFFCIPVTDNAKVIYYTDVFMFVIAVSSLVLLLHIAVNHYKNK